MQQDHFEEIAVRGFEKLPAWVRAKIQNVALLTEDEPSAEVRKREGLAEDETLLGYYQGVPLSERGESYGVGAVLPDTITLFRMPIEDEAACVADELSISFDDAVGKVVAETIWHEFAHHFGMDEHEVREREQETYKSDL